MVGVVAGTVVVDDSEEMDLAENAVRRGDTDEWSRSVRDGRNSKGSETSLLHGVRCGESKTYPYKHFKAVCAQTECPRISRTDTPPPGHLHWSSLKVLRLSRRLVCW